MSRHLKRLNAPRVVRLHRKEKKWAIRPSPGPHPIDQSIPLGLIIRDYLNLCDTLRETKRILSQGEVFVDGRIRKDYKFPVGLMDVISIPKIRKQYRVLYNERGKLTLVPITEEEASWKLYRIEDKTILKGKKMQLNLHDGTNKLVDEDKYHTGDVLKISFEGREIKEVYPREPGAVSLIIGGRHIGEIATIQSFEIIRSSKPNIAHMKGVQEFTTLQKYVFPIGKTKPVITLPEVNIQ
ncbi:MAG: 30S ribosomal protein S4e [Thermoplasmata archaeon]|nr:MAG: 30S ribosomal protein S4e [Thermoplasmata archaeon]